MFALTRAIRDSLNDDALTNPPRRLATSVKSGLDEFSSRCSARRPFGDSKAGFKR